MKDSYKLSIDKVFVFIPYQITPEGIKSYEYDYPAYRTEVNSWFKELDLDWEWVEITTENYKNKINNIKYLMSELRLVIFNFCDGSDTVPGILIVEELENSNIPFTGAGTYFYNITTLKTKTKEKLLQNNIPTSEFIKINNPKEDIKKAIDLLGFPFLLKPDESAGSSGIYLKSVIKNEEDGVKVAEELLLEQKNEPGFHCSGIFAESFIIGEEYTILIVGNFNLPAELKVFSPIQRVFDKSIPEMEQFLTYHRHWYPTDYEYEYERDIKLEPIPKGIEFFSFKTLDNPAICEELINISKNAFCSLQGIGYARMDIRYHKEIKKYFIIDVNSNCGLSEDLTSSVGNILHLNHIPIVKLIYYILLEAINR